MFNCDKFFKFVKIPYALETIYVKNCDVNFLLDDLFLCLNIKSIVCQKVLIEDNHKYKINSSKLEVLEIDSLNKCVNFALNDLPNSLKILSINVMQLDVRILPEFLVEYRRNSCGLLGLTKFSNCLEILDVRSNIINKVKNLPDSLKELRVCLNPKIQTDVLPNYLLKFLCSSCSLNSLPTLPSTLIELDCSKNELISIECSPNLIYLNCSHNNISSIIMNRTILSLDCSSNKIDHFDVFPNTLTFLKVSNNLINSFPFLPQSLTLLDAANCGLNEIKNIPNSLVKLSCENNCIFTIPPCKSSKLQVIRLKNNPLITLPPLPDSLYQFEGSIDASLDFFIKLDRLPTMFRSWIFSPHGYYHFSQYDIDFINNFLDFYEQLLSSYSESDKIKKLDAYFSEVLILLNNISVVSVSLLKRLNYCKFLKNIAAPYINNLILEDNLEMIHKKLNDPYL